MTSVDLFMLSPFIVLAGAATVLMLVIAFYRNHALTAELAIAGLFISFATVFSVSADASRRITSLFVVDLYTLFYSALIIAASAVVAALSYGYLKTREGVHEEFYLLLVLATLGSTVLAGSSHFASLFLGLEILSVSLYAMLAYLRGNEKGTEAGFKYLILAAASASFMLFGMALIYAETGTMGFDEIAAWAASAMGHNVFFLTGVAMTFIGIGFKLALVPFHMWTPDVYEGAPAPVSAFVATASKGAVFALLFRLFSHIETHEYPSLFQVFTVIAVASMFGGNLLALLQRNVKRVLAYSSISHLGYLLVAFLAGGSMATAAASYYLVAYFITMLGAFGVITVMSGGEREADSIDDFRGLVFHRPWLAAVQTMMFLSLAGIPLTAGFVGKFYVAAAGVGSSLWLLVLSLVTSSVIGLFYYLRVIIAMYTRTEKEVRKGRTGISGLPIAGNLVLALLAVLLLWLGIYPSPLVDLIRKAVKM